MNDRMIEDVMFMSCLDVRLRRSSRGVEVGYLCGGKSCSLIRE